MQSILNTNNNLINAYGNKLENTLRNTRLNTDTVSEGMFKTFEILREEEEKRMKHET